MPEEQTAGSEDKQDDFSLQIRELYTGPPPEGDVGQGLLFHTNRGDIPAIYHEAPDSHQAVIWVCGARGGYRGPGPDTYARLSEEFVDRGITSLRLDYRQPNSLTECTLDLLVGVSFLKGTGYDPVVLVGHSFGGAVVIAAGAATSHVTGVVALSPQTFGAQRAAQLSPRSLLVVHGKSDTRLSYNCAVQIHDWAREPKELVLYDGAEHGLRECREELEGLLRRWIPDTLAANTAELKTPADDAP
jgi:dienelactone hydrolase